MKKLKFVAIIIVCLLATQIFSVFATTDAQINTSTPEPSISNSLNDAAISEYLQSMIKLLKEKYNGEIDEKKLLEGSLKGMLESLDKYTTYFTADEYENFFGTLSGSFQGIGIMIDKQGDYVVIVKVFSDSPAEKAGFLIGDKIAKVGEKELVGATTDEVASLIRGTSGTSVSVGVFRGESSKLITLTPVRDEIKLSPVTSKILNGNIGYIKLDMFSATAYESLIPVLNEFDKKSISSIILDLRNNPGGLVDQAVSISQLFIPSGVITKLDYKSETIPDQTYTSNLEKIKYKLAVLMNKNSASASEIFAGAVQDTKAGVLVGTNSYGKGVVQGIYPILTLSAYEKYKKLVGMDLVDYYDMGIILSQKHGITPSNDEILGNTKITIGEYMTPLGRSINGKGLQPDIQADDYKLINGIDVNNIEPLKLISKPKLGNEGADILNAESILSLLGYEVDTPNTIYDKKSFEAMKKFQKDKKLYPYGVLDLSTQKVLNSSLESLVKKIDNQLAKGIEYLQK
jgi:carboxyl-terminal processing protease